MKTTGEIHLEVCATTEDAEVMAVRQRVFPSTASSSIPSPSSRRWEWNW
jgi:hypothetical protein